MKYLAAYALLTLSGKKDISTTFITQPQKILNLSSAASNAKQTMLKSKASSPTSRASQSTNSSPTAKRESEAVQHQSLIPRQLARNNNPRRNKSQRRNKSLKRKNSLYLSLNKNKIWEDSSIDRFIRIFKSYLHFIPQSFNYCMVLCEFFV